MKITFRGPGKVNVAYSFSNFSQLRNFLSELVTPEGYADGGVSVVSLSSDAAYILAAFAARGENLPRTDEERRTTKYRSVAQR